MNVHVADLDPRKISEPEEYNKYMGSFGIVADLFNRGLKEIGHYAEPEEADYIGVCDGINFGFKYKNKKPFLIHVWDMSNVLPIELRIMQKRFDMKLVGLSNQVSNLWNKYGVECKTAMPGCDTDFYRVIGKEDPYFIPKNEFEFVFLFESAPNVRSGLDLAIQAFDMAFRGEKNIKLIIKAVHFNEVLKNKILSYINLGSNIQLIEKRSSFEEMRALYNYADYCLHVYRHSSWGLGIHQSAACGSGVLVGDFCPSNEMAIKDSIKPREVRIIDKLPELVNEWGLNNAYGNFNYDEDPLYYDYDLIEYAQKMINLVNCREINAGLNLFYNDTISYKFSLKKAAENLVKALE